MKRHKAFYLVEPSNSFKIKYVKFSMWYIEDLYYHSAVVTGKKYKTFNCSFEVS